MPLPTATGSNLDRAVLLLSACGLGLLPIWGCGSSSSVVSTNPTAPTTPTVAACTVPAAAITHSAPAAQPAQLIFLDTSKYPQAVCNDGSAGAYAFRPGSGSAANRWVIALGGGGACDDQPSCAGRAASSPGLVSSNPYRNTGPDALTFGGILSTNPAINPDFYDATSVGILYCSSDFWSGAKAGSGAFQAPSTSTWNFQGRAILAAVLDDLKQNHRLASASEMFYTGESAGGLGVFLTIGDVAPLFGSSTRFVSSSDAGFAISVPSFDPQGAAPNYFSASGATSLENAANLGHALWGGRGDRACASAAKATDPLVNCYEPRLLLQSGQISQPIFIQQAQLDPVQLGDSGISSADLNAGTLTTAESSYSTWFAGQMRTALGPGLGFASVFSPDAFVHTQASDDELFTKGYTFSGGTVSDQSALGTWYRDPCTTHAWIAP